jgi:hypothetical protein
MKTVKLPGFIVVNDAAGTYVFQKGKGKYKLHVQVAGTI